MASCGAGGTRCHERQHDRGRRGSEFVRDEVSSATPPQGLLPTCVCSNNLMGASGMQHRLSLDASLAVPALPGKLRFSSPCTFRCYHTDTEVMKMRNGSRKGTTAL